MKITPELHADRGCWISDDRTYAFVSSATNSIAEIGYHGQQPVSRNSMVFAAGAGVCSFSIRTGEGRAHPLVFRTFDWYPGCIRIRGECGAVDADLSIAASGRQLLIGVEALGLDDGLLLVRVSRDALSTQVHGTRVWTVESCTGRWLTLRFTDTILLHDWMNREGPYGGDFLIPEPIRRTIFRRRCRSGLATRVDLLPEYRTSRLALYDASVTIRIGGERYEVREEETAFVFSCPIGHHLSGIPTLAVRFDDSTPPAAGGVMPDVVTIIEGMRTHYGHLFADAPQSVLPGYPHVEQFFRTVPGLVDSCIIRDYGVPRATPGHYYWIWAWDALVTGLAALRWGGHVTARRIVEFVSAHRDEEGLIPMRWTRSLVPLDTQPRCSLETLLSSLASSVCVETDEPNLLERVYPHMVRHLHELSSLCDHRGLFPALGFYPDHPLRFGRTERSATALEIAGLYTFCRTCERVAFQLGDDDTARHASTTAEALTLHFLENFWDDEKGFLIDAVDTVTADRNRSYPLFTFLFLHSSLGLPLVHSRLRECADFISRHLLTEEGMRLLPSWDRNQGSETVSGSWYPHWDAYALKILRRAGRSEEILRWLRAMERALERLGFCPEFLDLNGITGGDPAGWLRHGSPSNLNCVAGWYAALIEGVYGIDVDPGGITIIPLALPIDELRLIGLHHRNARWDVLIRNAGPHLEEVRIDGQVVRGCLKISSHYSDGGTHRLELAYGSGTTPLCFREILNAEVLEVVSSSISVRVRVRGKGMADVLVSSPGPCTLSVDGTTSTTLRDRDERERLVRLPLTGEHTLVLHVL